MQNDKDIRTKAIKEVLNRLYDEAKYAFHHDCEKCGEKYRAENICDICKQKDKELLENRIPKWEQKLKEVNSYN